MKYTYRPKGVCSQMMEMDIEDNKLKSLKVTGGCSGNLQGIAKLVEGMDIDDVINQLDGVRCGFRFMSCLAQLAQALRHYKEEQ